MALLLNFVIVFVKKLNGNPRNKIIMARKEILKAESKNFNFHYADGTHALKDINIPLYEKKITALIGPSGCGKSTFLRSFNRMHDLYAGNKYDGEIILHPDDTNILDKNVYQIHVRMRIIMFLQKQNHFPKYIY